MIHVNDSNFEELVLKSSLPVLVDFWSPRCGPCLALAPILERIAVDFKDKLLVAKMNVEENANIPGRYQIRALPTLLLLKNETVQASQVGLVPYAHLTQLIQPHL